MRHFRFFVSLIILLGVPVLITSADENDKKSFLSSEKITEIFDAGTPSPADLANISYSLEIVRRIPQDGAEVLGLQNKDPLEFQIEYALASFTGLGQLLGQDFSRTLGTFHPALNDVIDQTSLLLRQIPFGHLTVVFNFLFPDGTIGGSLDETPILSPLQAPDLNPHHIEFAVHTLHSTIQDLHDALSLPEAQPVLNWLFQSDSQNTYKLAYFGYQLNLLTFLFLGNVNEKASGPISQTELLHVLGKIRSDYGPSLMRAPYIFESLAARTTQPEASHIQTHVHSCLKIGDTLITDVLFRDEHTPLTLDGTEAWLYFLTDNTAISSGTLLTQADPELYGKGVEHIWNDYVEAKKDVINQLCRAHPQKPPLTEGQTEYADRWCVANYTPATVIELILAMTLIESLEDAQTFLSSARENGKSYIDLLTEAAIVALKSVMAGNYPDVLEGQYGHDTRANLEAQMTQVPISILTEKTDTEEKTVPYLKIDPKSSLKNLLALLAPDNSSNDWATELKDRMKEIFTVLTSNAVLGAFLANTHPSTLTSTPWDLPNTARKLALAFSGGFTDGILSYLDASASRDPEPIVIPFFTHLNAASQDKAGKSNIYRSMPLATFTEAVQQSSLIPITNHISDEPIPPYVQAWISAYPCDTRPATQSIEPVMYTKIYQDPDLVIQEVEKPKEAQDPIHTMVVPQTTTFTDALMSSLRLKLYGSNAASQRLMYLPILPPVVRSNHSVQMYKDLWWPKPEMGLPPNIVTDLTGVMRTASEALFSAPMNASEALAGEITLLKTKINRLLGTGQTLWLFDPDSIFLMGDIFRQLLLTQLENENLVRLSSSKFIAPQILHHAAHYLSHHLYQSQTLQDLLAEFEDHPNIEALVPYIQAGITGPIRSFIIMYELLMGPGRSVDTNVQLKDSIQAQLTSEFQSGKDKLIQVSDQRLTLTQLVQLIVSQYAMSILPQVIELADIQEPDLAMTTLPWITYFDEHHLRLSLEPSQVFTLSADKSRLIKAFDPILEITPSADGTQISVHVKRSPQYLPHEFKMAARIEQGEL